MPRDKPTERVNGGLEETFSKMLVSILYLLVRIFLRRAPGDEVTDHAA